jgi:hypothetical protein
MTLTIKLSGGKTLELTEDEFKELQRALSVLPSLPAAINSPDIPSIIPNGTPMPFPSWPPSSPWFPSPGTPGLPWQPIIVTCYNGTAPEVRS